MEPEPDTEEGVPPEALRRTPSAYQEYIKYGISAKGLRHVATEFQIGAGTTTSDLCQLFIKASTLPPGWKDEPKLTDEKNRYYSHKYVKDQDEGGPPQDDPAEYELMKLKKTLRNDALQALGALGPCCIYFFYNLKKEK